MPAVNPCELCGQVEASDIVGVSRSNIRSQYARGRLPEPLVVLAGGPLWHYSQIAEYARELGRKPQMTLAKYRGSLR